MNKFTKVCYFLITYVFTMMVLSFIIGIGIKVLNSFFDGDIAIQTYVYFLMAIDGISFLLLAVYVLFNIRKVIDMNYDDCVEFMKEYEEEHDIQQEVEENANASSVNASASVEPSSPRSNGFKKVEEEDIVIGGTSVAGAAGVAGVAGVVGAGVLASSIENERILSEAERQALLSEVLDADGSAEADEELEASVNEMASDTDLDGVDDYDEIPLPDDDDYDGIDEDEAEIASLWS